MGSHEFKRADRVGESIAREITWILQTKVNDPRLAQVAVTAVKVTDDLKLAKIYYILRTLSPNQTAPQAADSAAKPRPLTEKERVKGIELALKRAHGHIKRALASALEMRFVPDLHFVLDTSSAQAERIDYLLNAIHKADVDNNANE